MEEDVRGSGPGQTHDPQRQQHVQPTRRAPSAQPAASASCGESSLEVAILERIADARQHALPAILAAISDGCNDSAGTSAGDCATVTKPTRPSSLTTARTPSRTESRRPLPARSRKVSVTAETVSKLLRLGHGASSSRDVQDTAWTRGRRDPKPDAVVVVGVLRFDSVREGALAVSGFFLDDETGRVRLMCLPAPPSSWRGRVVCASQWTLTAEKKSRTNAVSQNFSACLEVSQLFVLDRSECLIPSSKPFDLSVEGSTYVCSEAGSRDIGAPSVRHVVPEQGAKEMVGEEDRRDLGHREWFCARNYASIVMLSEARARGAVGLEVFVGRRGRGPVDLIATVAAVSPIIRVKNAAPFFMVEVEQPPQVREHQEQQGQGRSVESVRQEHFGERDFTKFPRLLAEVASLFSSGGGDGTSDTGVKHHSVVGSSNNSSEEGSSERCTNRAPNLRTYRNVEDGTLHHGRGNARTVELQKSLANEGREDAEGQRHDRCDERDEQLMTNLVLNGRRCLPWHAHLVPGKTYIFPAVGAFVLGGSNAHNSLGGKGRRPQRMYRAFGDAGTAASADESRTGGADMGDIIEVDIGRSDTPPLEGMSRCAVPHDPHGKSFTRSCSTGQDVHVSSITSGRNDHGGSECGDGKGDVCCCHEGGSGAHVAGVGVVDEKAGGAKGTGHYDRCVNPTEVSREGEESDQRRHWQAQEEQRAALEGVGSSQGQEFMRTAGQRSSCQCVLTYEGEITGLAGYANTFILDRGRNGETGVNLYLQHFTCSSLGAGLRRGARVRVHNAHPVRVGSKVLGLGACLRTTVQVLSFSDLAGEASYRPLTGIPNPLPLAVHAWRHAFDTAFLRQEVAWQYSNDADITRISSQSASRWQGVRERRLAGWGQYVCRWVFGNSPQARNLLTRDVYAEFLDHPSGVCAIVGAPPAPARMRVGSVGSEGPEGRDDERRRKDNCRCFHGGSEEGTRKAKEDTPDDAAHFGAHVLQRADEGWHGDSLVRNESPLIPQRPFLRDSRRPHQSLNVQQLDFHRPSPEAVLRAAARPLIKSLEVAMENAVHHISSKLRSPVPNAPESTLGSDGSAGIDQIGVASWGSTVEAGELPAYSTFTVRTPFGAHAEREEGVFGFLSLEVRGAGADSVAANNTSLSPPTVGGDVAHGSVREDGGRFDRPDDSRDAVERCISQKEGSPFVSFVANSGVSLSASSASSVPSQGEDTAVSSAASPPAPVVSRAPAAAENAATPVSQRPLTAMEVSGAGVISGRAAAAAAKTEPQATPATGRSRSDLQLNGEAARGRESSTLWLEDRSARVPVVLVARGSRPADCSASDDAAVFKPGSNVGVLLPSSDLPARAGGSAGDDDDSGDAAGGAEARKSRKRSRPSWSGAQAGRYEPSMPPFRGSSTQDEGRDYVEAAAITRPKERFDALALVRKFAICTEVVVLGPAATSNSTSKATAASTSARLAAVATSERDSQDKATARVCRSGRGKSKKNEFSEKSSDHSCSAEISKIVDGVCVLLRNYLIVSEQDLFVLGRDDEGTGPAHEDGKGQDATFAAAKAGASEAPSTVSDSSRVRPEAKPPKRYSCDGKDCRGQRSDHVSTSALLEAENTASGAEWRSAASGVDANIVPEKNDVLAGGGVNEFRGHVDGDAGGNGCCKDSAPVRGDTPQHERDDDPNFYGSKSYSASNCSVNKSDDMGRKKRQISGHKSTQAGRKEHDDGRRPQVSVSEALVVRVTDDKTTALPFSSRNERSGKAVGATWSGPKIHPSHEREEITVRGLLCGVGFRVEGDGGRWESKGGGPPVVPSSRLHGDGGVKPAQDRRQDVDMFKNVIGQKMQLCLTLQEGTDRICAYVGVGRESRPVGMVPGFSTVQVEGVCRRLTGNGKNIYLTAGRVGGGSVKVLSLALPPPPLDSPALGWMDPSHSQGLSRSQEPGHGQSYQLASDKDKKGDSRDGLARRDGTRNTSCRPLLLFSRKSAPMSFVKSDAIVNAAATAGPCANSRSSRSSPGTTNEGAGTGSDLDQQTKDLSRGRGAARSADGSGALGGKKRVFQDLDKDLESIHFGERGPGVIVATRAGSTVLLNTHPPHKPPSPLSPSTSALPIVEGFPTHFASEAGRGGICVREKRSRQRCHLGEHELLMGRNIVLEGDVPKPCLASGIRNGGSVALATATEMCGPVPPCTSSPRELGEASSADSGDHEQRPTRFPDTTSGSGLKVLEGSERTRAEATTTSRRDLGAMGRRGVLGRATHEIRNMSIIAVRFVKAATWCKHCGPVRNGDLATGRCWARCHVRSTWEVRWEGSANVDDGTGQALLLLDGDDVVKLLRLTKKAKGDIETAARHHGPVAFSDRTGSRSSSSGNVVLASTAQGLPHPVLATARASLAIAASDASSSACRGIIAAGCVQVVKRGSGGSGGKQGMSKGAYGSAVVDVMGQGMETLTLPKVVLQGSTLENASAREEGYRVLGRLRGL